MLTAFVRINIVLTLLRQALGSPQVPGNQVITALVAVAHGPGDVALWGDGLSGGRRALRSEQIGLGAAWEAGSPADQGFMIEQIEMDRHQGYLESLYEYAAPASPGPAASRPRSGPRTSRFGSSRRPSCSAS